MKNLIRFALAPVICIGGYLISLSYSEYAKWQEYLILGDLSGAEAYEIGFWITVIPGSARSLSVRFYWECYSQVGTRKGEVWRQLRALIRLKRFVAASTPVFRGSQPGSRNHRKSDEIASCDGFPESALSYS